GEFFVRHGHLAAEGTGLELPSVIIDVPVGRHDPHRVWLATGQPFCDCLMRCRSLRAWKIGEPAVLLVRPPGTTVSGEKKVEYFCRCVRPRASARTSGTSLVRPPRPAGLVCPPRPRPQESRQARIERRARPPPATSPGAVGVGAVSARRTGWPRGAGLLPLPD